LDCDVALGVLPLFFPEIDSAQIYVMKSAGCLVSTKKNSVLASERFIVDSSEIFESSLKLKVKQLAPDYLHPI